MGIEEFDHFLSLFGKYDPSLVLFVLVIFLLIVDKYLLYRRIIKRVDHLNDKINLSLEQKDKIIKAVLLNGMNKEDFKKYLLKE